MAKSLRWVIVLVLVAAAAVLFVLVRMYRTDIKELKRFMAAYARFDTVLAESALRGPGDEAADIRRALSELQSYSGMRISSLIKNDGELMAQVREIADLAQKEVLTREGSPGEDPAALREKRKAAFARFMELAGTNVRDGR